MIRVVKNHFYYHFPVICTQKMVKKLARSSAQKSFSKPQVIKLNFNLFIFFPKSYFKASKYRVKNAIRHGSLRERKARIEVSGLWPPPPLKRGESEYVLGGLGQIVEPSKN